MEEKLLFAEACMEQCNQTRQFIKNTRQTSIHYRYLLAGSIVGSFVTVTKICGNSEWFATNST